MGANNSFPDKMAVPSQRPISLGRLSQAFTQEDQVVMREKKKKSSKFATLRKKLIRARRHSRSLDHVKSFREMTSSWTLRELHALMEEYEAAAVLKELTIHANLARPHARTIKEDLSLLYDYKYCTDIDLIYRGVCFPVHRAILCARCRYFRDLLAGYPEYGTQVPVTIRTHGVDVNMFSAILRYLYTGEFRVEDTSRIDNSEVLVQLAEEFGTPGPLETDLKSLLDTGLYSDAVLVFASEAEAQEPISPESAAACDTACASHMSTSASRISRPYELRCHKAILAARSPFFRSLLLRRARSGEELTERSLQSPTCIILDDSVIPRRYARVLLMALYMDSLDLNCIVRSSVSMCSLSEVQAMVAGKAHMTVTDEAMEIYQIAQFLDFPVLSQGCEDLLVETMAIDNLLSTLSWSREPHGSTWVYRQAQHYLREEFVNIARSPALFDLPRDHLLDAVQSDCLQACELDVLTAVLKWGEHQLVRRIEEREPNLLSHTAHSVSRKGVKKRDMSDGELRDTVGDLLVHVRTPHVVPSSHDTLTSAVRRGLISAPPPHLLADEPCGRSPASSWLRGKNNGLFVKPRFFQPFHDEVKVLLEEQLSQVQENDLVRLRTVHMSPIPDTLYMVEEASCCPRFLMHHHHQQQQQQQLHHLHHHHHHVHHLSRTPCTTPPTASTATVDIIAGVIPVPDQDTHTDMLRRETELQHSPLAQRAYALPCTDRQTVAHQIRLRVVREFGLPDTAVEVLHSSGLDSPPNSASSPMCRPPSSQRMSLHSKPLTASGRGTPQSLCRIRHNPSSQSSHHPRHSPGGAASSKHSPSLSASPARNCPNMQKEPSICSDNMPREAMPDIAMATASFNQMQIHDPEVGQPDLELDLGDGNSHPGTGTMYL